MRTISEKTAISAPAAAAASRLGFLSKLGGYVASGRADLVDAFTLPHFHEADFTIDWKQNQTEVTEIDRRAETMIVEQLVRERPGHGAFGEEHGVTGDQESPWRWVIDPIDGTRGYISGTPTWGVLVALSDEDGPMLGVIDQPYIGERFVGAHGVATFSGPQGQGRLKNPSTQA